MDSVGFFYCIQWLGLSYENWPHSSHSSLISLHLPAEPHTDTSVEADKSHTWSTTERERAPPPTVFPFYLKLFQLSRLLFSNPLILPPSLCPTNIYLILSSLHFVLLLSSSVSLLLTFTQRPRREKNCRQFRHNKRKKKPAIHLTVFKSLLAFSSDKTDVQPVCVAACGNEC